MRFYYKFTKMDLYIYEKYKAKITQEKALQSVKDDYNIKHRSADYLTLLGGNNER